MQVWDTAGQERFKNITKVYYKSADGVILAFSLTDSKSFENVEKWMQQIEENAPKNISKILVGTKCDLIEDRSVSFECAERLAKSYNMTYLEVSSKTGANIMESFNNLANSIKTTKEN
jgi:Ras-related protein Rab-8A